MTKTQEYVEHDLVREWGDPMTLQVVRRVVTGLDSEGRSAVLQDGPAANRAETPNWPGMGVTLLWMTDEVPVDNSGNGDAADRPFQVLPSARGTSFIIWQCPPLSELHALSPEARARALGIDMIKAERGGSGSHPGMHATETLDYLVLLSGELTLLLETGEVTLHAGDTLVDRGVMHAWENRGSSVALCVVFNVGALPLKAGGAAESALRK